MVYSNSSITIVQSDFIINTAGLGRGGGGALHTGGRNMSYLIKESTFNSASACAVLEAEDFNHYVLFTRSSFMKNRVIASTTASDFKANSGGVACINGAFHLHYEQHLYR